MTKLPYFVDASGVVHVGVNPLALKRMGKL